MNAQLASQPGQGALEVRSTRPVREAPQEALEYHQPADLVIHQEQSLARFLGWFSIGLGVTEVVAPRQFAQFIGVRDHAGFIPLAGLREIAAGIGILAQQRPAGFLWGRVVGDMFDLAFLTSNFFSPGTHKQRVAMATAAVAGVTLLDLIAAERHSERPMTHTGQVPRSRCIRVDKTITVNRPVEEIYQFWHNFENFPKFMRHLRSVQVTDDKHSHWEANAPLGSSVSWDAETTEDTPNRRIAWRSVPGSTVENSGAVEFQPAPGNRGTEVHVHLDYNPPGGTLGATFAQLFSEGPEYQVQEDLRHFRQFMETGELATTVGQPRGSGGRSWIPGV